MTQIDELVIRVPGGSNEEGHHLLGSEVAQRVAAALPAALRGKRIPELTIRLAAPAENGTAVMADEIAKQIVRQIRELSF